MSSFNQNAQLMKIDYDINRIGNTVPSIAQGLASVSQSLNGAGASIAASNWQIARNTAETNRQIASLKHWQLVSTGLELVNIGLQARTIEEVVKLGRLLSYSFNSLSSQLDELNSYLQYQNALIIQRVLPTLSEISNALKNPRQVEAAELTEIAERHFKRGDFAKAVENIEQAESLYPFDPRANFVRALCLTELGDAEGARRDLELRCSDCKRPKVLKTISR